MNFKGKIAIVTGSASGIGAATALKLAQAGAHVVINYSKSEAEAKSVFDECQRHSKCALVQGNVAEDEDCKRIARAAIDGFGGVDILVNNAGTTKFNAHANLDGLSAEDFQNIYAVNLIGPYQMIRACAPSMRARGNAAVVNVSSVAGTFGLGSSVAYTASKGALNTMTRSLARALAPEIRINAVCPGFVGTPWFGKRFGDELLKKAMEQQIAMTPLKRAGMADDIADTILFFASHMSRNVTGETLLVDAGAHLEITPLAPR